MAMYLHHLIYESPVVLSLADAKIQCKVEATFVEEDTLIQSYIEAAIDAAENYTNSKIREYQFKVTIPEFAEFITIPLTPISTIESVKYYDTANQLQTMESTDYSLIPVDRFETKLHFKNTPEVSKTKLEPIEIVITVGYASGEVPAAIVQAVKMMVTSFYENRHDPVEQLPKASTNLLRPYRFH